MDRSMVDSETGEVLYDLEPGDRVIRAASIEYFKKLNGRKSRGFTKVDVSEGVLVLKDLNANERSLMFVLQYYVSYESCLIRYPNGRDITFGDIVELSGWSRSTANQTLNGLIEKNLIYKGRHGRGVQYYMNPWIASRGPVVNATLKDMFKNYRIRSFGNRTWEEVERHGEKDRRDR